MSLLDQVLVHITFRSLIKWLLNPENTTAVDLLRSRFVGFLDLVTIDEIEQPLADFLTSEGVLVKPDLGIRQYRVASPLIDGLVRGFVIPTKYPNAPSIPPPALPGGRLIFKEILTESLKHFDKELIRLASVRSCKQSKVKVGDVCAAHVPRESVYDTELMRVLTNWLAHGYSLFTVTAQWHLQADLNKDKYCNFVIGKPGIPTVVLQLLATVDAAFVTANIEKTLDCKALFSADEAWVVHLTCEDNYLDYPLWQTDKQLNEGVNVVHFWHDLDFSSVMMSARWKGGDGSIQLVQKQRLVL